jgi:predicted nicotinamide N-methyase
MVTPRDQANLEATVSAITEIQRPLLCPEIRLHLKPSSETFESFRRRLPENHRVLPPFWAVAWPGGQALARYLIDKRIVSGLRVADLGAGSGLASIAANMSGAASVEAVDCDPLALAAVGVNARLNGVAVEARLGDLPTTNLEGVHAVLAGDLWYEPFLARQATESLRRLSQQHLLVLAGDPRRSYFPRSRRRRLATYRIAASEELEPAAEVETHVWQLLP